MRKIFHSNPVGWIRTLLLACMMSIGMAQAAAGQDANSAASLRARYAQLKQKLVDNQFMRPLYLDSAESPNHLQGDIYALVDYPFATVNDALDGPEHWCDVLILHLNTKYCHASASTAPTTLAVSIGKKSFEEVEQAYRVEFAYSVASKTPEYFDILLKGEKGPMGTSDYRIELEAVAVPGNRTFLHLTYSYAYNFGGRIAMQAYLGTTGSGKVGFSTKGAQSGREPEYIGGVRGVVERNTMRYYLAIDSYLGALSSPAAEQLEKRLQNWFAATELYSRQLHEVDRATYLDMKRREYLRQQKSLAQ